MPELPEVETIMQGLRPVMEGAVFETVTLHRADLRFAFRKDFASLLQNARAVKLYRRAKYICISLDTGRELVMHLGMSGRFTVENAGGAGKDTQNMPDAGGSSRPVNPVHNHVIFSMHNGAVVLYNDPRRFGYMDLIESENFKAHRWFARLGIEPLNDGFDEARLEQLVSGRKAKLKTFLLDQRFIAGLGNIYVCEALYRAGLSPFRQAGTLAGPGMTLQRRLLVQEIKATLNEAIAAGGSSLRDYRHADGSSGYFQHTFQVYGREGLPCTQNRCNERVMRAVMGGRSTFYCSRCQI